jgi:predicted phage terminase large subunit-like protein
VRELIDWWIGENGYAIPERSGIIRWFIRPENKLIWSDTKEELEEKYGIDERPKSLTFIPSRLEDNKILMEKDPAYKGNLMKLGKVERERLLGGNWNIRATAGTMFRREWFPIIDDIPPGWMDVGRGWDRAATPPNTENTNPDWTRGVKLYKYPDGTWVVADLRSAQDTPGKILSLIKTIASHDGSGVRIIAQQDPGSAGVDEMERFIKELVGYRVASRPSQKKKEIRATGVAAQAEHGFVKVLRAPWNKEFFDELEAFPDPNAHDDIVDALSAIFNELVGEITVFDNMSGFRGLLG